MQAQDLQPLTRDQSKAARRLLGMSQGAVIKESGLAGHKLKFFECGRMNPDHAFLIDLRGFYEGKGIDVDGIDARQLNGGKPGATMVAAVPRMAFYIADDIGPDRVDALLERMDASDDRIAAILKEPAEKGFIGSFSDRTDQLQRELFGLMAANYLVFRTLQGRCLVAEPQRDSTQQTLADLLYQWIGQSELAAVLTPPAAASDLPEAADSTGDDGQGELDTEEAEQ
jgi:hypothetical protein